MKIKNLNVIEYSNQSSLLSSILFLILGIVLFTNPGGIVKFISYITGSILIIIGITNLLSYYKTMKKLNISLKGKLVSGIVLIILGIISILFAGIIETTIRLIIGAWIIYSGIMRLIQAINFKMDKIVFITRLATSILIIVCGFYVVLKTNLVFQGIGICLAIYSIMEIIGFIICAKKTVE